MNECRPLAWAVHGIYTEARDKLAAELQAAHAGGSPSKTLISKLEAALHALPEEPEDGAVEWLSSLSQQDSESRVVPEIETWFDEPPDWNFEVDHLPRSSTAQGAALEFFQAMSLNDLETLGVDVVEGEHPGSSYYAAELRIDIAEANRAAEAADIPVRFVAASD
jgi:hypothetical protein